MTPTAIQVWSNVTGRCVGPPRESFPVPERSPSSSSFYTKEHPNTRGSIRFSNDQATAIVLDGTYIYEVSLFSGPFPRSRRCRELTSDSLKDRRAGQFAATRYPQGHKYRLPWEWIPTITSTTSRPTASAVLAELARDRVSSSGALLRTTAASTATSTYRTARGHRWHPTPATFTTGSEETAQVELAAQPFALQIQRRRPGEQGYHPPRQDGKQPPSGPKPAGIRMVPRLLNLLAPVRRT